MKIKKISKREYKGKVYDLHVDKIHAYNIEGLSVHNSGAGSLALYCLGITNVDPIKYDLLFERFLNPERISPPDVDIDFDYFRRDEIFDYIRRKYGADHCAQIGTYNSFKAKAVIRYAAKALDLGNDWENYQKGVRTGKKFITKNSLNIADEISKQIPEDPDMTIEKAYENSFEFKQSMQRYPALYRAAQHIEGTISSAGSHAAGIVACKDPIVKHVPLRCRKDVICTQFDKEEVEELGLLKFDCLALKTLSVISRTVEMIKSRHGKEIDINTLEPIDQLVFDLLNGKIKGAENKGVFQFESYGISRLLRDIRVDSFGDMVAATALFRPGPLGAGVPELYADYKHGRKPIKPLHPKMGELLKKTYSLIVYQEDFMKVAQELAGFTKGQSDTLRKAVGKKKQDLLDAQEKDFIEGCKKHNNVNPQIAKEIFEQIKFFGGYGFNKCLSGDTCVKSVDGKVYSLENLEKDFFKAHCWNNFEQGEKCNFPKIYLNSIKDGVVVEDEVVDVFEVGEKELFEVELDNGALFKCTIDHKFVCTDFKPHTLEEIIEKDLEILYEKAP